MSKNLKSKIVREILCYGETLWDLLPEGKKPGGAPMNVAMRLHRLGANTRFLSRIGDDDLGKELLSYIHTQNLATDFIQIDDTYPTGRVNVDVSDPTEVTYDIEKPAAWDFIDVKPTDDIIQTTDVVVFGSLAARNDVSCQSLLNLLEGATLKVFDINLRPPFTDRVVIESLLEAANWSKLNHHELEMICDWYKIKGNYETCIAAMAKKFTLETVCITLGADGALMMHKGKFFRQAGYKVTVADTIGSGDSFLAGWLYQMLSGQEPQKALAFACALGALVATHKGANPEISEELIWQTVHSVS